MAEHTTNDSTWIAELLYQDSGAVDRHAFDEGLKAAREIAHALVKLDRTKRRSNEAIGELVDATARYASQVTHVALNYAIRIRLLRAEDAPDNESMAERLEIHRDEKLDELFNEMERHGKVDRASRLVHGTIERLSTLTRAARLIGLGTG